MLKYRHTTIEDLPQIEEWIAADPAHAGTMKGSDFVLIPNAQVWVAAQVHRSPRSRGISSGQF